MRFESYEEVLRVSLRRHLSEAVRSEIVVEEQVASKTAAEYSRKNGVTRSFGSDERGIYICWDRFVSQPDEVEQAAVELRVKAVEDLSGMSREVANAPLVIPVVTRGGGTNDG